MLYPALVLAGLGLLAVPSLGLAGSRARVVAAGGAHTCALTIGGEVQCWGSNTFGQLGAGTATSRSTPAAVTGLTGGVAAVAAGNGHTCAVTTGGEVRCWGYNTNSQLGDGTKTWRATPVTVTGLTTGVAAVAAGGSHTCALTTDGGVQCWGSNTSGQLGDGTTANRSTPVAVTGLTGGVAAVAAGWSHTCALTTGGGVQCWGDNTSGELGDGTTTWRATPVTVTGLTSGVAAVTAGNGYTCALTIDGVVRCWGSNASGQLGDGTTTNRLTPVAVTGVTGGVVAVDAGKGQTCALTAGGAAQCWGDNTSGQLGDGTTTNRLTPVAVTGLTGGVAAVRAGGSHTCALTTGGGVQCWGWNTSGQLGDGTTINRSTLVTVTGLTSGVVAVGAGGSHTCALTTGGGVQCWGDNTSGQVGDGTTTNRSTPEAVTGLTSGVGAIATGSSHTCALTTGGGVQCWGDNTHGQVGDDTTMSRLTPVTVTGLTSGVAAVTAGAFHTCALTTGGGVQCWGDNTYGQLGDGTLTQQRWTPVAVTGLTHGVAAVTAGAFHTCALTTSTGMQCWGANWNGQLGDGTTTNRSTPMAVTGLTSGVTAVAVGGFHTCTLVASGEVQCWGDNAFGQLGDGTTTQRLTPVAVTGLTSGVAAVAAGSRHTCAVTTGGEVQCWGNNTDGELGDGTTTERLTPVAVTGLTSGVAAVAAGSRHTCAVMTGGGVQCWGDNVYRQLGDGSPTERHLPTRTRGFGQIDFDGDDVADVAVFRPASGTWFSLDSSTHNQSYGYRGCGVQAEGDWPAPGDYDGDGVIDPAVYRSANGTWFILKSSGAYTDWTWFGWGAATDTAVPGDYDGDGMTDAAVYRPSTGEWFIRPSRGTSPWSVTFGGQVDDVALPADYDGDGNSDLAIYRPASGTWFVLTSTSDFTHWTYHGWGAQAEGDQPVPGDYDGDGKTDLAVYRPPTGTWFILESREDFTTWMWSGWGTATDLPVSADYDGDGKTDLAIYRPSTGEWFIKPSTGAMAWTVVFGQTGDVPLLGIR